MVVGAWKTQWPLERQDLHNTWGVKNLGTDVIGASVLMNIGAPAGTPRKGAVKERALPVQSNSTHR
jgi:hypothetical protein